MNHKSKKAMQLALEALETLVPTKGPSVYSLAINALEAALAETQPQPEPEHTRKDGNYKVLYRCEDCGHEQRVFEIVANGRTYAGSGANWCDACGDGLPLRVVETAHDIEGDK